MNPPLEPPSPWTLVQSDLFRYTGKTTFRALIAQLRANPGFNYSMWLRLTKSRSTVLRWLANRLLPRVGSKYGLQIPADAEIGAGLLLGHHLCVVIAASTKIGDNCSISHFTTIGTNHGKAATIGNRVYIGPSVCIVEDVSIGDDACIGAGAVVIHDVPAGATVVGNPARVVNYKPKRDYIPNVWTWPDCKDLA